MSALRSLLAASRSLPRAVASPSNSSARGIRAMVTSSAAAQKDVPPPANTPSKIKIALCQTASSPDKAANIAAATAAIKEAASLGADVVVLPEMWHCPYGNDSFPVYAEEVPADNNLSGSESASALSQAAASSGVVVVGGSISEREVDSTNPSLPPRLFNTCLVFGPDGKLLARHRKAHLFDIDIPGKITFLESETLTPGGGATVVDVPCPKRKPSDSSASSSSSSSSSPPLVRLGIGICYDLRFPDYASVLTRRGAQVLIYPGAFNTTTGPAHWELLARARAVDAQAFVALCSPARISDEEAEKRAERDGGKKPYIAHGHSLAVSPWGQVLVDAGASSVGVSTAELDLEELATRRRNMPLAQQRRGDLYELVDKGR